MLLYTPGASYGTEAGTPSDLRGLAVRAASILHDHPRVRETLLQAFRTTDGHAYIPGAKQNQLAKLLEETGQAGQVLMTAFTEWAVHCPREAKLQLANLLKRQKASGLRLNIAADQPELSKVAHVPI